MTTGGVWDCSIEPHVRHVVKQLKPTLNNKSGLLYFDLVLSVTYRVMYLGIDGFLTCKIIFVFFFLKK